MNRLYTITVALLVSLLVCLPMCGCTVSQAKINTVVQDIADWSPVVSSDASTLLLDVASFEPTDASAIQSYVQTIQSDSATLTTLCTQYLASPSPSILAQITSLVSDLATNDSSALLAVLQIKDARSQQIAQGVLTTVATALTILSGYLATINISVTPQATTALNQMKPVLNRAKLEEALQLAKNQKLVPQYVTLAQSGL
jgi:uncharacterized membrane protein